MSTGSKHVLSVKVASGDTLDVREFSVVERLNQPFDIHLQALSTNADIDFDAVIGGEARFELIGVQADGQSRFWTGLCESIELVKVEDVGASTYALHLVPSLWLLSQRRNYRIFQDQSELDIVLKILSEWGITPRLECGSYVPRRYRVQYAETDLMFMHRLLEDIGVSYNFEQSGNETVLVLVDAPNRRKTAAAVPFVSSPNQQLKQIYVTEVQTRRQLRPGRYTQSDVDYRKPLTYPLAASSQGGVAIENKLERYHHNYGSFLWKGGGGGTPHADDRGPARTNESEGGKQVKKRLDAKRIDARSCFFATTAHGLAPGMVMTIKEHPRAELAAPLLIVGCTIRRQGEGAWQHECEARYTDIDYRPPLVTPKPSTKGVESATVTGPVGEEIHTDEFGRVRLYFHWDREGRADETSSCWVPVSQPWAGAGFGAISIPRVGQEVLVDFLGADPDRPLVMGRVFTTTTPPPYKLPELKMVGGMRSESYPKPRAAAGMGGTLPNGALAVGSPAYIAANDARVRPFAQASAPQGGSTSDISGVRPASRSRNRRAPAGGGAAVAGLGADGAIPEVPSVGEILPGPHGGPQAGLELLDEAVSDMQSQGPDGVDTRRAANGLVTHDSCGGEQLYLQAQRDMRISVKNNMVGGVGGNRAFSVLGNDHERVSGYQSTEVGMDRTVHVQGLQNHTVEQDVMLTGNANHVVTIKSNSVSQNLEGGQVNVAKTGIVMMVDALTSVFMLPDGIVIDAPLVFINPGPVMVDALKGGQSVSEAAETARAAEAAAQLQADAAALTERMTDSYTGPPTAQQFNDAADINDGLPVTTQPGDFSTMHMNGAAHDMGYTTPAARAELFRTAAAMAPN